MFLRAYSFLVLLSISASGQSNQTEPEFKPTIKGNWWQVAGNPDLGNYTTEKQQLVDFGSFSWGGSSG